MGEKLFLIEKRGLYYRPNAAGYTGLKREAGRYSFEEAAVRIEPNGPDGPRDGMSMWAEDEAPEFSPACPWDIKLTENATGKAAARISELEAENAALRKALTWAGVKHSDISLGFIAEAAK